MDKSRFMHICMYIFTHTWVCACISWGLAEVVFPQRGCQNRPLRATGRESGGRGNQPNASLETASTALISR